MEAPSESIETSLSREDQDGEMPDACNYISVSDVPSDPVASPPIREDHNNETPDMLVEEPSISLPQDQVIYLLTSCVYISHYLSYNKLAPYIS